LRCTELLCTTEYMVYIPTAGVIVLGVAAGLSDTAPFFFSFSPYHIIVCLVLFLFKGLQKNMNRPGGYIKGGGGGGVGEAPEKQGGLVLPPVQGGGGAGSSMISTYTGFMSMQIDVHILSAAWFHKAVFGPIILTLGAGGLHPNDVIFRRRARLYACNLCDTNRTRNGATVSRSIAVTKAEDLHARQDRRMVVVFTTHPRRPAAPKGEAPDRDISPGYCCFLVVSTRAVVIGPEPSSGSYPAVHRFTRL